MKGALAIVLHAHLPYVRHPEYPEFLEEDWLYEAITETYLPLLEAFDRLVSDGVRFRLTLTLTPPLVGMLRDQLLMERYATRLDKLCELTDREVQRTYGDGQRARLAWRAPPRQALSLTIPTLMACPKLFVIVPGPAKANAIRAALEGPIAPTCPASILRQHPDAQL